MGYAIGSVAYKAQWREKNREKCRQYQQTYVERNRERRNASSTEYRRKNQAWYNAYQTLRNRKVKQAKPTWVDDGEILDVYKEAQYHQLEVDHIVPITHPRVCGLHVPWNLQLLTSAQNKRKGNKLDEDIQVVLEEEENA